MRPRPQIVCYSKKITGMVTCIDCNHNSYCNGAFSSPTDYRFVGACWKQKEPSLSEENRSRGCWDMIFCAHSSAMAVVSFFFVFFDAITLGRDSSASQASLIQILLAILKWPGEFCQDRRYFLQHAWPSVVSDGYPRKTLMQERRAVVFCRLCPKTKLSIT